MARVLLLPLLLALLANAPSYAGDGDAERNFISALEQALAKGVPSVSAALATRQGVIWADAVGYADLQTKSRANTAYLYGIGSITKTFVACVLHQLVDEGKLDLDATPRDILGEPLTAGIPNADRASIRQLLNHTSGIPSWELDPEWIRRGRGADIEIGRIWSKTEPLEYVRGERSLATNAPGAAFAYSNTNYTLLGLVIEKITGLDALAAIRQRILVPLGLSEIKLEGFEPIERSRMPARYHFATGDFVRTAGLHPSFRRVAPGLIDVSPSNLSTEWTAGGMVATARDLAEYARALRSGAIVGPAGLRRMLAFEHLGETQVGSGLFRQQIGKDVLIGHSGNVLGFSAYVGWLESEDLIIVLQSNAGTMHAGKSSFSMSRLIEQPRFIQAAKALALELSPASLAPMQETSSPPPTTSNR